MIQKHHARPNNMRVAAILCTLILAAGAAAQGHHDGYLAPDFYAGTVKPSGSQWLFTPCAQDEGRAWVAQWLRQEDKILAEQLTAATWAHTQANARPTVWLQVVASVNSKQNRVRIHEVVSHKTGQSCRLGDYLDALLP